TLIEPKLPGVKDNASFNLLELNANDTMSIIAEMYFEKTYTNILKPVLINDTQLNTFIKSVKHTKEELNIVTYTFCGLLLMMVFFSLTSYFSNTAPEFLYYSAYAFFLGLMLFTKTFYVGESTWIARFLESYLDFIMQSMGVMFYMLFMQKFLETKTEHKFLYRLYNGGIILLLVSVTLYSYFHFFTTGFKVELMIETLTKFLLLGMAVIFIIYGLFHWKVKLLRFLVWGNLWLFLFALLSQLIITFKFMGPGAPVLLN